ncbi:Uncharacterized protein related to plant photosystem II stability/assembly factor [Pseudomonas putida]|nr:Uncharacterized protein related to plant photosystem II stability/assembly factor [Pseudomonas putida]CAB5587503.1 Uncharacterized protein related to plant photosystem II stability/assembly factor [Pseudomonas putida]CAB5628315.1 Uncharacterized protein related to plant photosystem II stability/assembly factor [Pseudomonas putida]CAB5628741.1 Uncharacterized protein related to plant photosystem II stability/assembly factor [Pseudomonas putida]CAB5705704.1 Uncharacterized protein related to p
MATPVIKALPAAPTRSDGADDFAAKADTFVAALPPLVVQINSTSEWIGGQVAAAEGYKTAAAGSASAAADSASAANTAKLAAQQAVTDAEQAGAAQVELAQDQVALSVAAKDEAQAAAQAAGSAAGLPSERVPYSVLQVTSDGRSAWGARDRIGEVVTAVKAQDASYIQTGSVYLQASYPELFQLLGKITTPGVYSFQGVTNPSGYTVVDIATDGNGTWIAACSETTGTSTSLLGYVLRSVDDGKTWTPVSIQRVRVRAVGYVNGVWVVVGGSYDTSSDNVWFSTSKDGGATWATGSNTNTRTASSNARMFLEVGESGGLVLTGSSQDIYGAWSIWTSLFLNTPSGALWSAWAGTAGLATLTAGAGGAARSGAYNVVVTTLGKMSRALVSAAATSTGSAVNTGVTADLKAVAAKAGTIIAVGASGTIIRSTDDAATFRPSAVSGSPDFSSIEGVGGGVWIAGTSTGVLWVSLDDGFTFTQTTPSGVATAVTRIKAAGNTVVLNSGTVIRRSESLYSYDQNTQFIVPAVAAPSGLKSFIKAREAA